MLTLQRILCPIDLSESSRQALIYARALSSWYEAPLTVLHVCVDLPVFEMASPFGHSASSAVVIDEAQIAERRAAVRTFVWSAIGDSTIDIVVREGTDARAEILKEAGNDGASMIAWAIGHRSRAAWIGHRESAAQGPVPDPGGAAARVNRGARRAGDLQADPLRD